jgi:hypothetical protein
MSPSRQRTTRQQPGGSFSMGEGVMTDRYVRGLLGFIAVAQSVLAILFVAQVPEVIALWPFEGWTDLSMVLAGSILLAAAASAGWCLLTGSDRAFSGIGLDYVAVFVPLALIGVTRAADGESATMLLLALSAVGGTVYGLLLLRWARRHPWRDPRPTPRLVIASFAVFVVGLLIAGGLLVAGVPGILPWRADQEVGRIVGLMFLGASAYFAYGLVDRRWENAGGQLAGFLAYDIVLIVPFVARLASGAPSYYEVGTGEPLRLNLVIYSGVTVYSGLLAAWYLIVDPRTRLRVPGRAPDVAGPSRGPTDQAS